MVDALDLTISVAAQDGGCGKANELDFRGALFLRARRFKVAVNFEGLRRASSMLNA